jgi:CRISPR-associated endoribonuclease Cas6
VLIGPAVEALPYFIQLFHDQGKRGLGRERGRFTLLEVTQVRDGKTQLVYEGPIRTLYAAEPEFGPEVRPGVRQVSTVSLEFLTPLRLKEKGDLVTHLTFPLFWERLRQRLTLLAAFYGDRDQKPDLSHLSAPAEAVSFKESRLSWYDWQRYSCRQRDLMKLGGLKGSITFSGELTPFLPYLRLGELVNLGQGTTFGLGRYRLTETAGAVGPDRISGGHREHNSKPF